MQTLWQDLRYGARGLIKNPSFTVIAVLTLALGIGANTAIFSVVNATLLRPLPFKEPERLYQVNQDWTKKPGFSGRTSPLNYLDWRAWNQSFEYLGGYMDFTAYNLSGGAMPERLAGSPVSDTLFPALGVSPLLGRNFQPEEDRRGGDKVVILSHRLWAERFGSDSQIIGQTLRLDNLSYTVIGVMPPGFHFPLQETQLWVPLGDTYENSGRGNFPLRVVGRLRSGVTREQAQSDFDAIAARLEQQYPDINLDSRIVLVPLHEQITGKVRPMLLVLFGAVGFVLLIACVNVANLLLARTAARQKEIAIRSALGASRFRIARQFLSESVLLAMCGGLLGLLGENWGIQALIALSPEDLPRTGEIGLDGRVLGFTFAAMLLAGLFSGLASALQASRFDLTAALKEGGRSSSGNSSPVRNILVVAEVTLALVLLMGAGLMAHSFWRLLGVNPGFHTEKLLTFDVALPWTKYSKGKSNAFFQEALERLTALPGVQSVGATTTLPLSWTNNSRYFCIQGRPYDSPRDYTVANHRAVSASYFNTLGIPVIAGRGLTEEDSGASLPVVVINQTFARMFFPNADPLGQHIKMGETPDSQFPWMTVVGIIGDVKHTALDANSTAEMYRPFLQLTGQKGENKMTFAVRALQEPESLSVAVRQEILAIDPDQPIANVSTMEHLYRRSLGRQRFNLFLLGGFGALALALAMMGVYGVISYTVTQNTREIGIRMALGAQAADVLKLVVGQGMLLALCGIVLGTAAAFALTRLMTGMLFEVTATDPVTFVGVSVLLMASALLACYLPARRAMKVDPMVALRYE